MSKMADADKENCPPVAESTTSSKRPFSTVTVNGSSPPVLADESVVSTPLVFPAEESDEDRDVLASDGKTLRKKRSVLFYPSAGLAAKSNQQPFSRSAAKRDSIMALGSIGYLQHLYTKQGIANRNRPLTKGAMTLAIGRAGEAVISSNAGHINEASPDAATKGQSEHVEGEYEPLQLPPSPEAGSYARPKYLDVAKPLEADTQALRRLLAVDLNRLLHAWGLVEWFATNAAVANINAILSDDMRPTASQEATKTSVDLLALINVTTKAIRSVRSYVLAFPRRSQVPTASPNEPSGRDRFKRQTSFSGVSRPGQAGVPVPTLTNEILHHNISLDDRLLREKVSSQLASKALDGQKSDGGGKENQDCLGIIRRAALIMLSALQEMEERNRTEALGANVGEMGPRSAGFSTDSDGSGSVANSATSGTGYLYRSDLMLSDFAEERKLLQRYLETVDSVMSSLLVSPHELCRNFSFSDGGARGDRSIAKTVYATPSIRIDAPTDGRPSETMPTWTSPGFGAAERVSGFMIDHCEPLGGSTLRISRMRSARNDIQVLLALLSDGYLLCQAFNEAIRRSDRPWGYISMREMHDLEAEEAALLHKQSLRAKQAQEAEATNFQTGSKRKSGTSEDVSSADENGNTVTALDFAENAVNRPGWTFRRTENLRVWATALKLRYQLHTTATRASAIKPATGPSYGSLGLGKLALHGRRVASESHAASSSSGSSSKTIDFDPARVARRESGWQQMLITLLLAWIDAVVQEQASM